MVKKLCFTILIAVLLLVYMPQKVQAANQVTDINVEVSIFEDGSAYITQTWNCNFSEGTEGYIPIENLGDITISDFLVSDGNGAYEVLDRWNINASFDEKAGKCGSVKTDQTQYSDNAHYYYMLAHRYRKASYETAQAARSAGNGGRSSFGGGGGFSGGGSGGGTR